MKFIDAKTSAILIPLFMIKNASPKAFFVSTNMFHTVQPAFQNVLTP